MNRYVLFAATILMLSGRVIADYHENSQPRTMTLTGQGTVKAAPDEGYINFEVKTIAPKSSVATANNSKTMKALQESLYAIGVKKEGIQTLEFSVGDNFKLVWDTGEDGKKYQKQVKDGFVVQNSVRVTVCDLDKFGDVLDVVASNGATSVNNIGFGSSKAKEKLNEARVLAVKEAKEKAKILVSNLDTSLGSVLDVHETNSYRPNLEYASRTADSAYKVPVSGGSLSFSVSVSVKWELLSDKKCCGCHKHVKKKERRHEHGKKFMHPPMKKVDEN